MKNCFLSKNLYQFLLDHYSFNEPLVLGYSGGPDSKALLYLLLEIRKMRSFPLIVAHVDHGWRKESSEEATKIEQEIKALHLPFFLKKLTPPQKSFEEKARNQRYAFFQEIIVQEKAFALLLAHQKEDLAETVLKRIFEGTDFFQLNAMQEISFFQEMRVFRPLLSCSKQELIKWLGSKKLSYINDPTNLSDRFARGKMRSSIIPFLEEAFGKKMTHTLSLFAKKAEDLNHFLDQISEKLLVKAQKTPFGLFCDLNAFLPLSEIELSHFLKKKLFLTLSREEITLIAFALNQRKKNYRVNQFAFLDNGSIFLPKDKSPLPQNVHLQEGVNHFGLWKISLQKLKSDEKNAFSWSDWLKGKVVITLPKGDYSLSYPSNYVKYGKNSLKNFLQKKRVPSVFRETFPILLQEGRAWQELTTGMRRHSSEKNEWVLKIEFTEPLI